MSTPITLKSKNVTINHAFTFGVAGGQGRVEIHLSGDLEQGVVDEVVGRFSSHFVPPHSQGTGGGPLAGSPALPPVEQAPPHSEGTGGGPLNDGSPALPPVGQPVPHSEGTGGGPLNDGTPGLPSIPPRGPAGISVSEEARAQEPPASQPGAGTAN